MASIEAGCVSAININSSNPQHPLVHGGGRARPRHGRATATQLQHRDTHPAAADARRPRRPAAAAGARETTNTHHHRQPPLYFGPSASLDDAPYMLRYAPHTEPSPHGKTLTPRHRDEDPGTPT